MLTHHHAKSRPPPGDDTTKRFFVAQLGPFSDIYLKRQKKSALRSYILDLDKATLFGFVFATPMKVNWYKLHKLGEAFYG